MAAQLTKKFEEQTKPQLNQREDIFTKRKFGLVTRITDDPREVSFLGTRGYIPPEGPGTPLADIFSLGKVLYEAYTGLDREQFPSWPTSLLESPGPGFAELNQVVLKACEVNPAERYQSAGSSG